MTNWILAARPKTLLLIASPVALGAVAASLEHNLNWSVLIVTLLCALLIQIGTNLANDYFDFLKGADTKERLGPTRVTQAGLISKEQVKRGFVGVFAAALGLGCYLAWIGGWPIAMLGLLSVASGIWYTAGRYSLAYIGLGELFVVVFFGPAASLGTYYLQTNTLSLPVFYLGLVMGFLSSNVLVVNNLRDINQDRKARKHTLAVLFGERFAKGEYAFFWMMAIALSLYLSQTHFKATQVWVCVLISPVAARLMRQVVSYQDPRSLNAVLGQTAMAQVLLAALISVGLLW